MLSLFLLGLAAALPASISAAPASSFFSDTAILTSGSPEEILRHFSKRQVDTVQGAAIILTLIVVGILGLIAGLTWAYLRGQPVRQKKCLDRFCCCCPCTKTFNSDDKFKDAVVLNGYGEVMAPVAKAEIDPTMWIDALDSTGKAIPLTPDQAILMMTAKAEQHGPLVQLQAPESVLALQENPLLDGEFEEVPVEGGAGTKIAKDDD